MILPVLPPEMVDAEDQVSTSTRPAGSSSAARTATPGVTGRKIIVDTYGGMGRHGGGAFSGKDPTKVDRSAAYMARYVAKNIVASGLAERCEVQLAYAIGVSEPVSVHVDTFGTGQIPDGQIADLVRKTFPLTPSGIIKHLDLRRPIYRKTASGGHFGRSEPEFTWEKTDKAEALQQGRRRRRHGLSPIPGRVGQPSLPAQPAIFRRVTPTSQADPPDRSVCRGRFLGRRSPITGVPSFFGAPRRRMAADPDRLTSGRPRRS